MKSEINNSKADKQEVHLESLSFLKRPTITKCTKSWDKYWPLKNGCQNAFSVTEFKYSHTVSSQHVMKVMYNQRKNLTRLTKFDKLLATQFIVTSYQFCLDFLHKQPSISVKTVKLGTLFKAVNNLSLLTECSEV